MVVLQRGSRSESDTTALREGRGEKRCRNPPFPSIHSDKSAERSTPKVPIKLL